MQKKILGVAFICGLLATPTALNQIGKTVGSPALAAIPSVHDIMMMRSPGPRAKGALTSTKERKAVARLVTPHIPVPAEKPLPVVPLSQITRVDLTSNVVLPEAPMTFGSFTPITPLLTGSSGGGGSTIPGGGFGGGGGGIPGGGIPFIPTNPDKPVTPVTPVPEPSTWAMMLVGFALVGWSLRHRGTRMQRLQL